MTIEDPHRDGHGHLIEVLFIALYSSDKYFGTLITGRLIRGGHFMGGFLRGSTVALNAYVIKGLQ